MASKYTYNFSNKVAFVSGAANGIGSASAIAFAEAGAKVAVVDVDSDNGEKTAQMAREAGKAVGGDAFFIKCDVSKSTEVKQTIAAVVQKWGRLDVAFNNAGIEGKPAPTADCTEENWDRVMNINLKGVWLCMKEQIPLMLKQGNGSIVNCASIAGLVGFVGIPAYVASKHAILGLTKTTALEYAKTGLRVNAICPGVIDTPMIDRFTQGNAAAKSQFETSEPVGRMGKPEEIAMAALWLCSEQSSFVTGHSLVVDGGWVAQ